MPLEKSGNVRLIRRAEMWLTGENLPSDCRQWKLEVIRLLEIAPELSELWLEIGVSNDSDRPAISAVDLAAALGPVLKIIARRRAEKGVRGDVLDLVSASAFSSWTDAYGCQFKEKLKKILAAP